MEKYIISNKLAKQKKLMERKNKLNKEKEILQKEKDDLISKMNVGSSYSHGGKSEKSYSELSKSEKEDREKKDFEAMFSDKFSS